MSPNFTIGEYGDREWLVQDMKSIGGNRRGVALLGIGSGYFPGEGQRELTNERPALVIDTAGMDLPFLRIQYMGEEDNESKTMALLAKQILDQLPPEPPEPDEPKEFGDRVMAGGKRCVRISNNHRPWVVEGVNVSSWDELPRPIVVGWPDDE